MASVTPIPMELPDLGAGPAPAPAPKPMSLMAFVAVMVTLTALGVGAGGFLGLQLSSRIESKLPSKAETRAAPSAPAPKGRYAGATLKPLQPIVTNLGSPDRTWIRLEAVLIMEGGQGAEVNVLAAQISEDIIAFLRTVPLHQMQDASGFQHLREDLNDRVRTRSAGKVRDLVIQSLIVE